MLVGKKQAKIYLNIFSLILNFKAWMVAVEKEGGNEYKIFSNKKQYDQTRYRV